MHVQVLEAHGGCVCGANTLADMWEGLWRGRSAVAAEKVAGQSGLH